MTFEKENKLIDFVSQHFVNVFSRMISFSFGWFHNHNISILSKTTACNRTYDDLQGGIYSPGWPGRTRSPMDCVFNIQAPDPASTIALYFGVFGVLQSNGCTNGFLEVNVIIGMTISSVRWLWLLERSYSQYFVEPFIAQWDDLK